MGYPIVCFFGNIDIDKVKNKFKEYECYIYPNDQSITTILQEIKPHILVTIADSWKIFSSISKLPLQIRKRWLHYNSIDDIQPHNLLYCYKNSINKKKESKPISNYTVSVIVPTFNRPKDLCRAIDSILVQTYLLLLPIPYNLSYIKPLYLPCLLLLL